MTVMRLRGLNKVKAKGKLYYYHRASNTRLKAEFGTAEFVAELQALEAAHKKPKPEKPLNGTLGAAIEAYRATSFFQNRAVDTKLSYDRVLKLLDPVRDMPLVALTSNQVAKMRDKLFAANGRWNANMMLTVLSLVSDNAVERGAAQSNPVAHVRKIPKPTDAPVANRPWKPEECEAVLAAARPYLKVPIALAMLAGLRKGDVLTVKKTAIRDGLIHIKTSKRGVEAKIPIHPVLRKVLDEAPAHEQETVAANSRGERWTKDGFNTSFGKLIRALEEAGKVEEGLTLHGLRHTLGTRLKEAGASDREIADILAQTSLSMAKHYSRQADTTQASRVLIEAADVFGANKRKRLQNFR